MKRVLGIVFLFSFILVSSAFAESPDLTGTWKGKGTGMLPNGYVIDGLILTAKITNQVDGLFQATFVVKVPGMGKSALSGVGYIGPDGKLKALWNYEGQVIGIAEATVDTTKSKWTMEGVGRDYSDGSINVFKLTKKK